eukprot:1132062-Rhodomonas_salina.1
MSAPDTACKDRAMIPVRVPVHKHDLEVDQRHLPEASRPRRIGTRRRAPIRELVPRSLEKHLAKRVAGAVGVRLWHPRALHNRHVHLGLAPPQRKPSVPDSAQRTHMQRPSTWCMLGFGGYIGPGLASQRVSGPGSAGHAHSPTTDKKQASFGLLMFDFAAARGYQVLRSPRSSAGAAAAAAARE